MISNLTPSVFNFEETRPVRVIMQNSDPWFIAKDISGILDYGKTEAMTRRLDDDEKGTTICSTPGGEQEMTIINESGLYSAILGSSKPEAKRFKKWVTSEVLPSIRKTGRYAAAAEAVPALGFGVADLPLRYRGVPVMTIRMFAEKFQSSIDAVQRKIRQPDIGLIDGVDFFYIGNLTRQLKMEIGLPSNNNTARQMTLLTLSGVLKVMRYSSLHPRERTPVCATAAELPTWDGRVLPMVRRLNYRGVPVMTLRQIADGIGVSTGCLHHMMQQGPGLIEGVDIFRLRGLTIETRNAIGFEPGDQIANQIDLFSYPVGVKKLLDFYGKRLIASGVKFRIAPSLPASAPENTTVYRRSEPPAKDEHSEYRGLHFAKLPYRKSQFRLDLLLEKCRALGIDVNAETREFTLLFYVMHAVRLTATRGCVMPDGEGGFKYEIL